MAKNNGSKGISLAKGPVLIVGVALLAFGILALLIGGATSFTAKPLSGMVSGKKFIGLEVNGWSSLMFIASGAVLVFGSPLHWGAKLTSILVGIVLVAAAVLAYINDDSALGIFAANGLTELVWLAAGALLLVLALLPRVSGGSKDESRRRREGFSAERVVERESVEGPRRASATRSHRDTSWDDHATR
jgi:hypothetical protein